MFYIERTKRIVLFHYILCLEQGSVLAKTIIRALPLSRCSLQFLRDEGTCPTSFQAGSPVHICPSIIIIIRGEERNIEGGGERECGCDVYT